mmetsp:Transcript_14950/g.45117  ORF Transcript_14950/g.45117 Transcript_14950/m.45117 type:complete len:328 (+) Transcript_14950:816-1799(+)
MPLKTFAKPSEQHAQYQEVVLGQETRHKRPVILQSHDPDLLQRALLTAGGVSLLSLVGGGLLAAPGELGCQAAGHDEGGAPPPRGAPPLPQHHERQRCPHHRLRRVDDAGVDAGHRPQGRQLQNQCQICGQQASPQDLAPWHVVAPESLQRADRVHHEPGKLGGVCDGGGGEADAGHGGQRQGHQLEGALWRQLPAQLLGSEDLDAEEDGAGQAPQVAHSRWGPPALLQQTHPRQGHQGAHPHRPLDRPPVTQPGRRQEGYCQHREGGDEACSGGIGGHQAQGLSQVPGASPDAQLDPRRQQSVAPPQQRLRQERGEGCGRHGEAQC